MSDNLIKYCKECVISNQRPSSVVEFKNKLEDVKPMIQFTDGVCSACIWEKEKSNIDWNERRNELELLCDKFRKTDGTYDCIIPGSGGKDSAFTAHFLKYELGMNPLTVTWAPHQYTDIGWKNFKSWIDQGGFDNILFHPNGKVHKKLAKLAFQNLGHPFQPFIIGQKLTGPRASILYDIPLIFYGENQAEYGNKIEDNYKPTMDLSFFSTENFLDSTISGIPVHKIINDYDIPVNDLTMYRPLDQEKIDSVGSEVHYLSYYTKWDPQEMYYYAAENTGFRPNPVRTQGTYSRYAGIDDVIEWLHFYMIFIKFGIGRATYDAAQEIRNQKITREEGISLVQKYDHEFPDQFLNDFLDYFEMNSEEFFNTIDKFRNPEIWKKDGDNWELKTQVS